MNKDPVREAAEQLLVWWSTGYGVDSLRPHIQALRAALAQLPEPDARAAGFLAGIKVAKEAVQLSAWVYLGDSQTSRWKDSGARRQMEASLAAIDALAHAVPVQPPDARVVAASRLAEAAEQILQEAHRIHDTDPPPLRYRAPYGGLAALAEALATYRQQCGSAYPTPGEQGQ